MTTMRVPAEAKQASISARVIRADGTVEDLGVISYWHRSWWRRALWKLKRLFYGCNCHQ